MKRSVLFSFFVISCTSINLNAFDLSIIDQVQQADMDLPADLFGAPAWSACNQYSPDNTCLYVCANQNKSCIETPVDTCNWSQVFFYAQNTCLDTGLFIVGHSMNNNGQRFCSALFSSLVAIGDQLLTANNSSVSGVKCCCQ